MSESVPETRVTARLHGGPRNGETLDLPWARYDLHLPAWGRFADDEPAPRRLAGPWRGTGQPADYEYVPDAAPGPAPSPAAVRVPVTRPPASGYASPRPTPRGRRCRLRVRLRLPFVIERTTT